MMQRRGMTVLELIVAGVILLTLLTLCLQVVEGVGQQHRAIQHRQLAVEETANLMERLMADSWDHLTPELAKQCQLSPELQQTMPEARLEIVIDPVSEDPDAKRIQITISWPRGPEQPDQHVDLIAWKYRQPIKK